jgi:putrescine transport system permease protein
MSGSVNAGAGTVPRIALAMGYLFLYAPVAVLVVNSFNGSRLVTVWGGFSTRWYVALIENDALLSAAGLSLQIAAVAATIATVTGTLAAIAVVRFSRFRGRAAFLGLLTAPLVLPEVILGLSLLLLFVAMEGIAGWPAGRGMVTVVIAHATFAIAYVAVVVQARLSQLDRSLEEAAADLGARPVRIFLSVTLPLIWPAVAGGWLLAFTLSFDDLVVASFTTGPGATTLPIAVFSAVRLGVSPQINALATVFIVTVTLVVVVANILILRRQRPRGRIEPAQAGNQVSA